MGSDRPRRKQRGGSIDMAWEDEQREKIRASGVCNRLIDFVKGEIKLEKSQVTAALGLLRKIIPDLSQSDNKTEVLHKYVARVPSKATNAKVWQEQHEPTSPTLQ